MILQCFYVFKRLDGLCDLNRRTRLRMEPLKTERPDVSADCGTPCVSLCTDMCDYHGNIHVQTITCYNEFGLLLALFWWTCYC
jgi:hypothetical protein